MSVSVLRTLVILASIMIILAGLRFGQAIVAPLLLASFFAVLLAPTALRLRRIGIPNPVVLILMLVGIATLAFVFIVLMRTSLDQFIAKYPVYETSFRARLDELSEILGAAGFTQIESYLKTLIDVKLVSILKRIATSVGAIFGQLFLIVLVLAFILGELEDINRRFDTMTGVSEETNQLIRRNLSEVRHYMSLKTVMSLITGGLVGLLAWIMGLNHVVFLSLLAFLLNFIPTVGSFVAALPGIGLAFVLFGLPSAFIATVGYVIINVAVSNIIEPRFVGQSLGVSPTLIIVGLVFWGWLLGAIGALLSVPLTLMLRALLESHTDTRSIAVFFGPAPEPGTDPEAR